MPEYHLYTRKEDEEIILDIYSSRKDKEALLLGYAYHATFTNLEDLFAYATLALPNKISNEVLFSLSDYFLNLKSVNDVRRYFIQHGYVLSDIAVIEPHSILNILYIKEDK